MADRFEHPHEDDDAAASADRFADALDLCRLAWDSQKTKQSLKKLQKLEKDKAAANTELVAAKAEAAEIRAAAHRDAKAIHEAAAQRLEAAESAEQELAQREMKIARLEAAWRYIGEPGDVLSGLRSPEFSPLQKARMAHGQPPGKDPDLLFSEPDAAPAVRIDALSDTSDDPHADRQGAQFLGGLSRDVSHHKRKSAA